MGIALVVIGSIAGLAAGVWLGLKWGMRLSGGPSFRYWLANLAMALGGLAIAIGGQLLDAMWFAVSGVGVMGGGITGLKYGYGASPGVWAVHDRLMGIDGPEGPAAGEGERDTRQ